MTATTASRAVQIAKPATPKADKKPAYVSWESFQNRFLSREDGHTYEWANGVVEKSLNSMDITQLYIWLNISKVFNAFASKKSVKGNLITEADIFLNELLHRRPDICFLTDAQIFAAGKSKIQIPAFVAEIISPNDKANRISRKNREYFAAGVQVVWNIYPALQEVHVYDSPDASRICRGDDLCSAEKAIPGFAMPVSEILKEEA